MVHTLLLQTCIKTLEASDLPCMKTVAPCPELKGLHIKLYHSIKSFDSINIQLTDMLPKRIEVIVNKTVLYSNIFV